jgi:cytochrome P450 family 6
MFPLILEVCDELKKHIQRKIESDNPEFDAKGVAANYTTDVVASCAFGLTCTSLKDENNEFREMGKKVMTPSKIRGFIVMILFFIPSLSSFFGLLGIRFIQEEVTNFFRKLVHQAFEFREKNNYVRNDMIQLLMQLKKSGEIHDDEEEEKGEVKKTVTHSEEGKIGKNKCPLI